MSASAFANKQLTTIKAAEYTFAYCPADKRWGISWMRTRQQFPSVQAACGAAAQWMESCYEHGWPIAIRIEEVA